MLFIYNPGCETCGKIKKWLDENQVSYTERDITAQPPTPQELTEWAERGRLSLRAFWDREKFSFKKMRLMNATYMDPTEISAYLIAGEPKFIAHPILVGEDFVVAGSIKSDWQKALQIQS